MADNEIASLDSAPGQDLNATKLHEVCFAFTTAVLSLPIEQIWIENKRKDGKRKNVGDKNCGNNIL